MNLRLQLAQIYIPGFIKKKRLEELFYITADAFNCAIPDTRGSSCKELLKRYALLTRDAAEKSIQHSKELQLIKRDLYENAYRLGKRIRKSLCIRNAAEVKAISRLLYNIMGIDFQWGSESEILIKECYFSRFYSSRVCRVISSLDEGLLSGLSEFGKLCFYQRITEGNDCCKAHFTGGEIRV
ncbi:MAG: hypothetical protein GH155_01080 [Spirochaeta sp.]|nr:hypothetical protein [Spirochaeta sp.]